jgi:hypothetical protein
VRQARARSRSPPPSSRTSSTASIRVQISSDLKPSLRRKKSVIWHPALDEVHGTQSGPSVKTSGRCAPPIPGLSSYHDHIPDQTPEPEEHSLDATRTLNAIEIEYRKIRPSCLDFLNPPSNPINLHILEREHLWLADLLVSTVLQELDFVKLGKWDEKNRRARKALATEVNELLKQMDEFLTEQQSSPVQDLCQDIRPQDLIPIQQQEKSEPLPIPRSGKAGASSSRNARPLPDPCLGHRIAYLTRQELLRGGVKGMYITHEKYDGASYVLPDAIENFYIEVPPGSRPGEFVKAKLFRAKNTFEDSMYFAVKLALDDEARWPDRNEGNHRGSENQPSHERDDRVSPSQTRRQSRHNKYHGNSAEEEPVPYHRHSPVKSILKTTQTTQTDKSKTESNNRKTQYDHPRSWDDYAHVADHDHMRRARSDDSSSDENTSSDASSQDSRGSQRSRASRGSRGSGDSRDSCNSSDSNSRRSSRQRKRQIRDDRLHRTRSWTKGNTSPSPSPRASVLCSMVRDLENLCRTKEEPRNYSCTKFKVEHLT